MWIALLLIVGSVLLVVSGFTWAARRDLLARARDIEALRVSALDMVHEPQMVAVRGRVHVEQPLTDPITGEPVAFYEARLSRVDGGEKVLRTLRTGDRVIIEDEHGRAEVVLAHAELALPWVEIETTEREPSPKVKALLDAAHIDVPTTDRAARYGVFHRAIRPGDVLTVVGTPAFPGKRALPHFEANGAGLVVTDGDLDALKARERSDVRAMNAMLQVAVLIGFVLVAVGVGFLAVQ
jgi:hypothetical protein